MARLQVSGGAIAPAIGNSNAAGILFPGALLDGRRTRDEIQREIQSVRLKLEDLKQRVAAKREEAVQLLRAEVSSADEDIARQRKAEQLFEEADRINTAFDPISDAAMKLEEELGRTEAVAREGAWMRCFPRDEPGSVPPATLELGVQGSPNDHILLKPSGNVGIGTDAPTEKLHVAGNILVTGALKVSAAFEIDGSTKITGPLSVGSTAAAGALSVTGVTTLTRADPAKNTLTVEGDATFRLGKVTVENVIVANDLIARDSFSDGGLNLRSGIQLGSDVLIIHIRKSAKENFEWQFRSDGSLVRRHHVDDEFESDLIVVPKR
jgi:hypothetical protein